MQCFTVSSPLEVEVFDGEGEGGGKQQTESGHHQTGEAQELMPESKLILQQLIHRQCVHTISQPNQISHVSILRC